MYSSESDFAGLEINPKWTNISPAPVQLSWIHPYTILSDLNF